MEKLKLSDELINYFERVSFEIESLKVLYVYALKNDNPETDNIKDKFISSMQELFLIRDTIFDIYNIPSKCKETFHVDFVNGVLCYDPKT